MKTKGKPNSKNWITAGLILTGTGMIVLGVVFAMWVVKLGQVSDRTTENAVVPAEVNFNSPRLELTDLQGLPVSLEQFRGKVVLINNWATWCPPCKAEMPTLQTYYERHEYQGFVLVAINAGDPVVDVEAFSQSLELTFPIWLDAEMKTLSVFRNDALPSSYVVDQEGIIRLAWTGPVSLETLEKYVSPLLED
jgi:thiol-disulfide isomerase/thioredoxin